VRRADARKGQKVKVRVADRELVGTIGQVGDPRFPGLRDAARVTFGGLPEVGAIWAPIKELEEVKD
jgi:hypothetical protein